MVAINAMLSAAAGCLAAVVTTQLRYRKPDASLSANGWIAGLVNAYPEESVRLFELARSGGAAAAADLYAWFLPLLRLDTVPKFVQLIKLAQQTVGLGSERVRAPRLVLEGEERAAALAIIGAANAERPVR